MNLAYAFIAFFLALILVLVGLTRAGSWLIERRNPPVGSFADIGGAAIHYVHVPGPAAPDLPPVVFLHGASGNLLDQMLPLRPLLEGRAELLFVDRPGHGWSERGDSNETQAGQAATLAALMEQLGIEEAIVVAHSFGGSVAAAFSLDHPERVKGLVFLSAATHPWPGGATSWYYRLTTLPLLGWLFSETVANPAGTLRLAGATECVFAPNPVPQDYAARTGIPLILRPAAFRANAVDVEGLYRFALENQPRYGSITAPTIVVSGDADTVVYEEIHSLGLVRDIPGSELVWIENLGHKPDWVAPDLVVAAIEKLSGRPVDLQQAAKAVQQRIANDAQGAGRCFDEKPPVAGGVTG